ncbi:MAG: hypothetical protein LBT07_01435, partial [Endomicrobium sp.]|nr:hypothetical protein [Endomicrobium sp.]
MTINEAFNFIERNNLDNIEKCHKASKFIFWIKAGCPAKKKNLTYRIKKLFINLLCAAIPLKSARRA